VRIVVTTIVAVIVIYFARGLIGDVVAGVFRPFYILGDKISDSTYITDRDTLREEVMKLKGELLTRDAESETMVRLRAENEALRNVLGRMETDERIAAAVIAQPPFMPYDALLIDRGSEDGIKEGAVVYHYGNRAVGVVGTAYPKSALVTLFSTPDIETTVYILGPDIFTKAYGMGAGTIRVSVPQDIELSEGDVVVLPSLETGILGTVTTVDKKITEPEQHGFIVADESLQSLRVLSIARDVITQVSFEEALQNIQAQEYQLLPVAIPEDLLIEQDVYATTTPQF